VGVPSFSVIASEAKQSSRAPADALLKCTELAADTLLVWRASRATGLLRRFAPRNDGYASSG
jgi:hypothetical protein